MSDKWVNSRGHYRRKLPPCPQCFSKMNRIHEHHAACSSPTCGFTKTITLRHTVKCECGREVVVQQHQDNPDKWDMKCECGYQTVLTVQK